jgi:hypothetical protein
MIIVSQDKKFIVNFHNVIGLKVEQVNELSKTIGSATKTTFIIIARFSNEKLDCFLGKYATEERAKEVLNDIFIYNGLFGYYKCSDNQTKIAMDADFAKDDVVFDAFEMPLE